MPPHRCVNISLKRMGRKGALFIECLETVHLLCFILELKGSQQRPFMKTTSPIPPGEGMGFGPIHYTGVTRQQSPIPSNLASMRPPLPTAQRTSPVSRKTPPAMNFAPMNEVPQPSQATMPEETPIIRMSMSTHF